MKRLFLGSGIKVLAVENKKTFINLLDMHLAKMKTKMIKAYDKLPKEKLYKVK